MTIATDFYDYLLLTGGDSAADSGTMGRKLHSRIAELEGELAMVTRELSSAMHDAARRAPAEVVQLNQSRVRGGGLGMRLSELIAHAEGLVDTVRDFRRGTEAMVNTVSSAVPNTAEAVQALGRRNAELKREVRELRGRLSEASCIVPKLESAVADMRVGNGRLNAEACDLRTQATKDRSEIAKLKDKLQAAERQVEAHRETIRGYFEKLDAEACKGNPNGKTTSANTDR